MHSLLNSRTEKRIANASGVGTPVARSPRHRPERAVFPHPVPRSYSLSRERHVSRKHQFVLQAARLGDAGFGDTKLFDGTTEGRPCETLTLTPAPVQPLERIGSYGDSLLNALNADGR